MKDPDSILRDRYAKEADDVFFRDLEMDERLKSRIRAQLPTDEPRRKRPRLARRRRVFPLASAAAVLLLIAALHFGKQAPEVPQDTVMEKGPVVANIPEGTKVDTGMPMSTFTDPGEVAGQAAEERAMASIGEAQAAFAGRLLVPSAVPDGYTLTEIRAYGMSEAKADKIALRYTAADAGEFTVTASLPEAERMAACPNAGEPVRIGLEQGCLRSDGDGTIEIYWTADQTLYAIAGNLTADQLLAIAETLTIPGGE